MFCSKQEINYQQRNQAITKSPPIPIAAATSKLINSNQPIEQVETNLNEVNKQQGYSSTSSVASSSYFITESKSEIIQFLNNITSFIDEESKDGNDLTTIIYPIYYLFDKDINEKIGCTIEIRTYIRKYFA